MAFQGWALGDYEKLIQILGKDGYFYFINLHLQRPKIKINNYCLAAHIVLITELST
jgi:hypothetical protein